MSSKLFDFAVMTIFARECLEGSIIIGEYRTVILRGNSLAPGVRKEDALSEINVATLGATAFALLVIAGIAIPLAILSSTFNATTAYIIEGISKIVAGISLLQLSLKLPKFLGVYGSTKKKKKNENETPGEREVMTLREIRFNVAWNIWREVAECGVFLIPFFLSGDGLKAIPLSAVIGSVIGLLVGLGIYIANQRLRDKRRLAIFAVLLLVFLSAGLFTNGCHKLEMEINSTKTVWSLDGDIWDVNRLPMTVIKPFGYNDSRTVLEIVCFWSWLVLSGLLHYRKYRISPRFGQQPELADTREASFDMSYSGGEELETVEMGEGSLESQTLPATLSVPTNLPPEDTGEVVA
jgi:high-affinity iron transporter